MRGFFAFLAAPMTYVILFALGGASSLVAGVLVLAGVGWALVVIGALLFAAAQFISLGLRSDG